MPPAPNNMMSIMPMQADGEIQTKEAMHNVTSKNVQMLRWLLQHMVKTVLDNAEHYSDHVAVMYEVFKSAIMKQLDTDIS